VLKRPKQEIRINTRYHGKKLFQFLDEFLEKKIPKSALMKWIRKGAVRVDGKKFKPFDRVFKGQVVTIPSHELEDTTKIDTKSQNPFLIKKIYEDDEILVLYKPPNLPTQPGKGVNDSLYQRLKNHYQKDTPYLVHRLDKETSGLIVTAKTYSALHKLQQLFKKREITKVYLAWVIGTTHFDKWTKIEHEFEEERDNKKKYVKARSYIITLVNKGNNSLLGICLVTGRKHQIRIQLSKMGHPIVGEKKYGNIPSTQGLLLHAYLLTWEDKLFVCNPPWMRKFMIKDEFLKKIFPLPK